MNGAQALLGAARAAGVEVCFANPGTSEMQLVAALDSVPGMRAILGLFEGVCTGAADGYGRMLDRPALTLLHHGPGFANGIANLHNAWRARTPLVNLIGDHPDAHLALDAPLTSDIASLARPVSNWLRRAGTADELARDVSEAIAVAGAEPGNVATLIVPNDLSRAEVSPAPPSPRSPQAPPRVEASRIRAAEELLRAGPCVLLLGARGLRERALRAVERIAAATGCRVLSETFPARVDRGPGLAAVARLPYFPEPALSMLSEFPALVLAGAREPVSFFAYPDSPSRLVPDTCTVCELASPRDDVAGALEELAEAVAGVAAAPLRALPPRAERPRGGLEPASVCAALAALQPEGAIVMEEATTSAGVYFGLAAGAPPHTYLSLTGGAIGQGPPVATGAAVACPDRPVIDFQSDGAGLYTLQALWTQAREGLDVTTLVCANRSYRILEIELSRSGVREPGPQAASLTDLSRPTLDWVSLAQGFGVPACRVDSADALTKELEHALSESGPHLIEIPL